MFHHIRDWLANLFAALRDQLRCFEWFEFNIITAVCQLTSGLPFECFPSVPPILDLNRNIFHRNEVVVAIV
jgi:hypothetical protein